MKIKVTLENGFVSVGERKASLLSGTFHYWRVHPESWSAVLQSIQEMGLETIETYVPWQYHELEPGLYDFSGQTDSRRDLAGFLQLVEAAGLWLIIRPGPYIYSEWVNMGVPDDVLPFHRLHPQFKQRAAAWLENVTSQLLPYLATNGGNIILLQPDNEADTFEQVYLEQLGLGETPGLFQQFLYQAYQGDLTALNRRWGSAYHSFDQARALMVESDLDENYRLRYRDFVAFRASYINEVVRYYGEQYRQLGVDIPMFANAYDITNVQDFKALEETIGLVGIDSYPPNEFSGRFSPQGEDYKHRRLNEVWRSLRTLSKFAYLAEYQAGIAHGLHYWAGVMTPNHFAMTSLTAIQAGVQAWNWFMLVNHDNFMMCPINEWGRKQGEHFAVFAEMTALYRHMDVPALQRVTEVSLLYHPIHQLFSSILDDRLLSTIYRAGIDYEFYNLETGRIAKPVLFYTGPRWLSAADQRKLLDYVEQGGDLVFCQTLPLYDDDNQTRCNILELVQPDAGMDVPFLDHLAPELEVKLGDRTILTRLPFLFFGQATPGEPILAACVDTTRIWDTAFEENRKMRSLIFKKQYRVGYIQRRGRGRIVVLSLLPTPELLHSVLGLLGVVEPVRVQMAQVKHALFHNPGTDAYYLILINTGNEAVDARVDLQLSSFPNHPCRLRSLRAGQKYALTHDSSDAARFYIHLPRKDGVVVEI